MDTLEEARKLKNILDTYKGFTVYKDLLNTIIKAMDEGLNLPAFTDIVDSIHEDREVKMVKMIVEYQNNKDGYDELTNLLLYHE